MRAVVVNLKHLEAFVTVADLGTFRRAAERLHTTQPNISTRIAQLERHLGVTLMDRDAGSVRLTPKGRELLDPARAVIGALDGFLAAAHDDGLFEGVLRLGVTEMVAHTWLRDFLLEMKERFRSVDVELTVDLSSNLSAALFDRDLDLAFQSGPFDRAATRTVPLGSSAYTWVAAPSLGIGSARLQDRDVLGHPILTHARGTAPFRQIDDHFRSLALRARLVPSSNLATCLQMTQDGLGIACLPAAMVEQPLEAGRLHTLNYAWRPEDLRFAARFMADPAPTVLGEAVAIAQRLSPPEDNKRLSRR
jgi:DNA-binding transcriptional LysR family regulator